MEQTLSNAKLHGLSVDSPVPDDLQPASRQRARLGKAHARQRNEGGYTSAEANGQFSRSLVGASVVTYLYLYRWDDTRFLRLDDLKSFSGNPRWSTPRPPYSLCFALLCLALPCFAQIDPGPVGSPSRGLRWILAQDASFIFHVQHQHGRVQGWNKTAVDTDQTRLASHYFSLLLFPRAAWSVSKDGEAPNTIFESLPVIDSSHHQPERVNLSSRQSVALEFPARPSPSHQVETAVQHEHCIVHRPSICGLGRNLVDMEPVKLNRRTPLWHSEFES